jgi:hypothetical protein
MRPYSFLAVAAPLVLAIPAPAPAPVAAPAPKPLPMPQGVETDPITGLVSGLINGVLDIGSLSSAVPAVLSDLGDVLDAAGVVTRKFSTPPVADSVLKRLQRPLQTALFSEPMFLQLCRNCSKPSNRPQLRPVPSKQSTRLLLLLESQVRIKLHLRNRTYLPMPSRWCWMDLRPAIYKL